MNIKKVRYSDQELSLLLQSGDEKDFNSIYDCYGGILYGFLLNAGLTAKNSAEILELTFIKIWSTHQVNPSESASFLTWMIKLLTETVIEYLKANNRTFTIKYKNTSSIYIDFTDVLEVAVTENSQTRNQVS